MDRKFFIDSCAAPSYLVYDFQFQKSSAIVDQFRGLLAALVESEQQYLSETKQSRANNLQQTQLNAEDLVVLRTNRDSTEAKFSAARDKLTADLETEQSRFGSEKTSAVEQLMTSAAKVSESVDKLRQQSETFVTRGGDAWKRHCADTETSLLRKSDESTQNLAELKAKTEQIKVLNLLVYQNNVLTSTTSRVAVIAQW